MNYDIYIIIKLPEDQPLHTLAIKARPMHHYMRHCTLYNKVTSNYITKVFLQCF